jgi:hypothetical protein
MVAYLSTMEETMCVGSRLGSWDRGRLARIFLDPRRAGGTPALPGGLFCALSLIAGLSTQAVSAEYLEGNKRQKSRWPR